MTHSVEVEERSTLSHSTILQYPFKYSRTENTVILVIRMKKLLQYGFQKL